MMAPASYRCSLLLLVAALLLTGCPRTDIEGPVPLGLTDGEERALRVVQSAFDISREEGESIWPGYALHSVPLLVFRPGKRSFLINPQHVAPEREQVVAPWLTETVYWVDSRSLKVSPSLPFAKEFGIDGGEVFLVRHRERSKDPAFFRLLVHEVFHFHQHRHWEAIPYPDACRYPFQNEEHAFYARLEEKALGFALALEDVEALTDGVRTYVALRQARYASGVDGEVAMAIEEWEELIEGTARYVEERYAVSAGYATLKSLRAEWVAYLARLRPKDLQKWKYYRTGAGLALILDALSVAGWKTDARTGNGPFPALAATVGPLTANDAARVKVWRERFDSERADVAKVLAAYNDKEQAILDKWQDEGAYEISVQFPARGTAYYTNRGITMLLPDCSRLASGIVAFVDRTYGLEVNGRGIAMKNDEAGFHIAFHHDLSGGEMLLDKTALTPGTGEWTFSDSITIAYPKFQLTWQGRGTVVRDETTLTVVLEP